MWSAVKAARWYVFLTVLLFIFFLIVYMPAQFALMLAGDTLARSPVKIDSVSGSVWKGRGIASYQNLRGDIEWSVNGLSLLTLHPEIALNLKVGRETEISAKVKVSDSTLSLNNLSGSLQVPLLNPYLKAQRVSGQGVVKLYDLSIDIDHSAKLINNAEGRLLWQDAKASYPGPKGIESISLPDVAGRLSHDDKGAVLNVLSGKDGAALASVFVMNQGWAGIKVRKRSVDMVGQTWVGNQQPDDVIFQVREKLW
ncbi:type II secretion system protein N [Litoribrevibacter albus]|uniref:Type II secretion system protein N n=1 Tax=Litoribrevibacter albus TaxID=1473156 RepID=A0AA37W424_9GAMM|nr:type II secretion system protein N [Litoribrevibacter albus]GLQ29712.1 hypothetical protein GCM10007876_01900 [Litoribrevibacter albus]